MNRSLELARNRAVQAVHTYERKKHALQETMQRAAAEAYPSSDSRTTKKRPWMLRWGVNTVGARNVKPAKRMRRGPLGYPAENSFSSSPGRALEEAITSLRKRCQVDRRT